MAHERTRNLVVRLSDDEHAMAARLAEAKDEPMTMIVRKLLRSAYVERFGLEKPSAPRRAGGEG